MEFKGTKALAAYYLRGFSEALTTNQEIEDLSNDIDIHCQNVNKELLEALQIFMDSSVVDSIHSQQLTNEEIHKVESAINKALNK